MKIKKKKATKKKVIGIPFEKGNKFGGSKKGHTSFSSMLKTLMQSKRVRGFINRYDDKGKLHIHDIDLNTDTDNLGQAMAITLMQASLNGDIQALKELMDRVDGKAVQTIITEDSQEVEELKYELAKEALEKRLKPKKQPRKSDFDIS